MVSAEQLRLDEADTGGVPWRRWGPYLSERQWGTVREDYGSGDNTWSYFPHEQARSRAYRWGEDGLAVVSDDRQHQCLALGLWNGRDPHPKEQFFGLTNAVGNLSEDVKECYFYLDATPTSSYLKMLYKYPQAEFPYACGPDRGQLRSGGSQIPNTSWPAHRYIFQGADPRPDTRRARRQRDRCRSAASTCRGLACCSMSTSTVIMEPASARVTRPAGPAPWRCCRCCSAASAPRHCAPAAVAPSRARQRAGGEGWRDDGVAGPAGDL